MPVLVWFGMNVSEVAAGGKALPSKPSEYFLVAAECEKKIKECVTEAVPSLSEVRKKEKPCSEMAARRLKAVERFSGGDTLSESARSLLALSYLEAQTAFIPYALEEAMAWGTAVIAKKEGKLSETVNKRFDEKFGELYAVFKRRASEVPGEDADCDAYFFALTKASAVGLVMASDFYFRDDRESWDEVQLKSFVPTGELLEKQGGVVSLGEARRLSEGHSILYIRDTVLTGIKAGMMRQAALAQSKGYRVSYMFGDNRQFPPELEGKHAVVVFDGKVAASAKLQFVYDMSDKKNIVAGTLIAVEEKLRGGPVEMEVISLKPSGWWPFE